MSWYKTARVLSRVRLLSIVASWSMYILRSMVSFLVVWLKRPVLDISMQARVSRCGSPGVLEFGSPASRSVDFHRVRFFL